MFINKLKLNGFFTECFKDKKNSQSELRAKQIPSKVSFVDTKR